MFPFEKGKTPTEARTITFDFTAEVPEGVTIGSPSITATLLDGPDTGAAALVIGGNLVTGKLVLVLISGGLEGSNYRLLCRVTGSDGQQIEIAAMLPVTAAAA